MYPPAFLRRAVASWPRVPATLARALARTYAGALPPQGAVAAFNCHYSGRIPLL
jgi:hypothetical protein